MLAYDGAVVLDVHVTKNENCYPMVAPGKNNAQMIGIPERKEDANRPESLPCSHCGTMNLTTNNFCPVCGTKL